MFKLFRRKPTTASDPTATHQLSAAGGRVGSASSEGFADFERLASGFAERKPFVEPDRDDFELWKAGKLVPWLITQLLDAGNHVGPQVDIACKAQEPAVDMWEVGRAYPSWEQTVALARFLDVRVRDLGHPDARPRHESRPSFRLRCLAIMSFEPTAVEAAVTASPDAVWEEWMERHRRSRPDLEIRPATFTADDLTPPAPGSTDSRGFLHRHRT